MKENALKINTSYYFYGQIKKKHNYLKKTQETSSVQLSDDSVSPCCHRVQTYEGALI